MNILELTFLAMSRCVGVFSADVFEFVVDIRDNQTTTAALRFGYTAEHEQYTTNETI